MILFYNKLLLKKYHKYNINTMKRCSKAYIYKDNLKYNIQQIQRVVGNNTDLCIAIKADGYGNNAFLTASIAQSLGINKFAIATVDEAIELRKQGIKSELILLSLCVEEEFEDLFSYRITPLVFSNEYIDLLISYSDKFFKNNEKFPVHLAIDTGMGRIGCYPEEAGEQAKLINNSKHLFIEGTCTHFATSDGISEESIEFTNVQINNFKKAIQNINEMGINPGICHCGSSAIAITRKDVHFDLVRPGIITYGYYPDEITKEYLKSKNIDFDLKPVMSLETKIVAIRHFLKGKSISYGRTWICDNDTDIAILPIGYADGLLRRYSPGLSVTINGKNYPIRGRICMDQCMVDIGKNNNDVHLWDKAIIFGPKESGALNTAETLAKIGNTISYEVMTSISKRIEKEII